MFLESRVKIHQVFHQRINVMVIRDGSLVMKHFSSTYYVLLIVIVSEETSVGRI